MMKGGKLVEGGIEGKLSLLGGRQARRALRGAARRGVEWRWRDGDMGVIWRWVEWVLMENLEMKQRMIGKGRGSL